MQNTICLVEIFKKISSANVDSTEEAHLATSLQNKMFEFWAQNVKGKESILDQPRVGSANRLSLRSIYICWCI